jgi:hypothetical protein
MLTQLHPAQEDIRAQVLVILSHVQTPDYFFSKRGSKKLLNTSEDMKWATE